MNTWPVLEPTTTLTISVFTRHSLDCPKRDDPQWKRCRCRKSLYIYEGGKRTRKTANTRSWEQAERVAQAERDKRNPVKIELGKIAELEAAKEAARALKETRFADALDQWYAGMKKPRSTSLAAYRSTIRRMKRWAEDNGVVNIGDVKVSMLNQWRSKWSPDAEAKENRLALNTQAKLQTRIKAFFAWAVANEILERNPSTALKAITTEESQTWPLTPEQFEQVMESTKKFDADCRYKPSRAGQHLRAVFLVQRWTGLRIGDALVLPRSALREHQVLRPDGSPTDDTVFKISLTTQKTRAEMECTIPDHVAKELNSLPRRPQEHPDYFFWSRSCTPVVQTNKWIRKVKCLNKYLSLVNEHGEPMEFKSHMLRDTFAVEMLLAGVALDKVSRLLSHKSTAVTERYYTKWVKSRQRQLEGEVIQAMRKMGALVGGK